MGCWPQPKRKRWGWQSWQQLCGEATLKNARACQNKRPRVFSRLDNKPCYRHGSLKVKDMTEQFNRIIQMLINVFYIILMSSYRFMTLRARFDWDACKRERGTDTRGEAACGQLSLQVEAGAVRTASRQKLCCVLVKPHPSSKLMMPWCQCSATQWVGQDVCKLAWLCWGYLGLKGYRMFQSQ